MPNTNYILTPEGNFISETELYHHGIKGQKWGVRKAAESADKVYRGVSRYGNSALEKKSTG